MAHSVRLSWQPSYQHPVESYVIFYKPKYEGGRNYDEIEGIAKTEHVVEGLTPFTTYEFRVLAVNNIGRGNPSNPYDVTTGEKSMIDVMFDFKVSSIHDCIVHQLVSIGWNFNHNSIDNNQYSYDFIFNL